MVYPVRSVAHLVRSEGINQAQLADRMEVVPITLVRLIDKLEASGLVERRADPRDRRAYQLFLTPAAQPMVEMLETIGAELREDMLAGLSDSERDVMVDLLLRVKGNLTNKTPESLLQGAVHE